ncbi:MAG: Holliday junction resolvase RuvX [Actinomycetes bacterium]
MRAGARLGVDIGEARIGVAASDSHGLVATPVETVRRGKGDLARLGALAAERDAVEIVVGLPRSLSGRDGPAAEAARAFAARLAAYVAPVPVRLVDERLSTVSAERGLRATGVDSRQGRAVVDQAAAAIILQSALDAERGAGGAPGQIVQVEA